jgi:prepilin-type N-terminal cleavage/methylation domain-containing protein
MKRKLPSPPFRVPVDFGDEPARPVPITRRPVRRPLREYPQASHLGSWTDWDPLQLVNSNSNFRICLSKLPAKNAFTLVEILVVLVLLSLIIFALMAVFSGTQRAFRAGLTYADSQQSGRTVMDMLSSDIASATPSYYNSNFIGFTPSNQPVNFYISEQNFGQAYPPTPLFQNLLTSPSGAQVTNLLEKIFILSKNNLNGVPSWVATGYAVNSSLADGTLYPLYRFYMTTNVSSGVAGVAQMFNNFVYFQYANSNVWSHLMDGVVRLTATAYDTNGVWMTNGYSNPSAFHVRFVNFAANLQPYGLVDTVFYSNALPASVQIELGTLEDRTLQHAQTLNSVAQSNYLAGAAGQLHIFRQRVWVRNLDPTAYQQ